MLDHLHMGDLWNVPPEELSPYSLKKNNLTINYSHFMENNGKHKLKSLVPATHTLFSNQISKLNHISPFETQSAQ